jgi:aspartyl-tRNA(Asn)/glutamyl-tRNA(Gln) amidotransferase subunit A
MIANRTNNGHEWTIDSVRDALGSKRISARELTAEFYRRIEQRNPELNAYLALSPERAYEQADRLDGLVARGEDLPELAGLPLAVKDVIARPSMPRRSNEWSARARLCWAKRTATSSPWAAPTKTPLMAPYGTL